MRWTSLRWYTAVSTGRRRGKGPVRTRDVPVAGTSPSPCLSENLRSRADATRRQRSIGGRSTAGHGRAEACRPPASAGCAARPGQDGRLVFEEIAAVGVDVGDARDTRLDCRPPVGRFDPLRRRPIETPIRRANRSVRLGDNSDTARQPPLFDVESVLSLRRGEEEACGHSIASVGSESWVTWGATCGNFGRWSAIDC